jgi:SpoU rRNA methylase family enzyme
MTPTERNIKLANFILSKYRKQAAKSGVYQAARNMRKQGYPLELAQAVLLPTRELPRYPVRRPRIYA